MRNEEIYKYLEKQENSIKEVLDARLKGFKAEIRASQDIQIYKLDELIEYQKKQNNRIGKVENETRVFRLIHRNPKASVIVGGFCILGIIALFVLKNVIL